MSSARLPHRTAILPAVSSMDEVQLAQHVRSNIPGPIGDTAASFIRVLKISGRIFMEMQCDDLEIISQGDSNVMQIYLKLQGKVVTGRLRERRRSLAEVYPELGSRFPSLRGLSNEGHHLGRSSNEPDESTQQYSASDQGAPDTSPALQPVRPTLALDDAPAVKPMVQTRYHHPESMSEYVTDGTSVEVGTHSKDVVVEGEMVAAPGLASHEIASTSLLMQRDELFALDHVSPPSSRTLVRPTPAAGKSRQKPITNGLYTESIAALANASGPTAQTVPHRLEFDGHTSPAMAGGSLKNDQSEATGATPFIEVISLGIIPTIQEGGEAASHGSIAAPQNTGLAARSIEEPRSRTRKSTPRPKEDVPSVTPDLQATPTIGNEPSDQGASVHVDERSTTILSHPCLDETPSVDEAACLELNGSSAVRTTHICDPISEAACNLFRFDPRRTEDPCPLDLSAVIFADDNDMKMSQNILHTPRAASADPVGELTPASLPLDAGGVSIGSPKRSNSTSLTPGAFLNVSPIASTSPVYFQDLATPSLSPDPPHSQISCNTNGVLKAGTEAAFRTPTPHIFDNPASPDPGVGPSSFDAIDGGIETHPQVFATLFAPSRVASLNPDIETAVQGYYGMVPEPASNLNAVDSKISDPVSDTSCPNFLPGLPDSSETALPLKIETTQADHLPDYTSRGSDIDYMGAGLSPDGLSMDNTLINATDGRASTKDFPGMVSKEDPGPFTSDDSEYDTASEYYYAADIIPPANLSEDPPVLECSGHRSAARGPGGPLLCLLPIVSRLPSLEYWYSPTDTSESCHLWSNIFGQVHTSCREACAEPTMEIASRHMFSTIPSLSGQDELYETTTLPLRSDVDTGKSHESEPAANSPVVSAHSTLLPQLDLPNSSLTEDISAISALLRHSVLPSEACKPNSPSAPIGSKIYFLRGGCSQRSLFPITGGHHDSGLRTSQGERTHAKEELLPSIPPTPPSPVCQVASDVLRTKPKDSPMDQEHQYFRMPISATCSPPKHSVWERLEKLFSLTART